MLRLDTI